MNAHDVIIMLQKKLLIATDTLLFYASKDSWNGPIILHEDMDDCGGHKAREAIAKIIEYPMVSCGQ